MSKFPRIILFSTLFLASALTVLAQEAIDIKMTKMNKAVPLPLILSLILAALVFAGIVYIIISRLRNKTKDLRPIQKTPEPNPEPKTTISMKQQTEPIKNEQYYRSIFDKKDNAKIIDEIPEKISVKVQKKTGSKTEIKIENYLKKDERIVLNILKMKNNSCSQATIQIITDFSKAHLSRIIAELTERRIIVKNHRSDRPVA